MTIFGYTFVRADDVLKLHDIIDAGKKDLALQKNLNDELSHQNSILKQKVDGNKLIIEVDMADPTPTGVEQRKEYVTRVAGFYKDVLEQKCRQMIAIFHKILEEETNDRETDLYTKLGIYVAREWMKWGETCYNEFLSYSQEGK